MMKSRQDRYPLQLAIVFAVILPLVNTLVLGPIRTMVGSDIAYPEFLSELLGYVVELISIGSVYACAALLAGAYSRSVAKIPLTLLCTLSVLFVYLLTAAVDGAFYGVATINTSYVLYNLVNCLFELLRLAAVILVSLFVAKRAAKKGRPAELELFSLGGSLSCAVVFSALTVFISLLITKLINTLMLFIEYGAPLNISEVIYLILPYVTVLVYSILGYFLMYLVAKAAFLPRRTKQIPTVKGAVQ